MADAEVARLIGREAVAAVRRPVGEARGLPGPAYTGEAFYRLEQERLFPRTWMSVAYGHDIPAPGDAVPVTAAGVPVIVLRGSDGTVRAFHNVCRHRASLVLCAPARGLETLQCPYHAWTYGLDGSLLATPYFDGTKLARNAGIDRQATGLVPIRCGTWHDLIFINLSGDAPAFEAYIDPVERLCAGYDLSAVRFGMEQVDAVAANWKLAVENFAENYHEPWVHPSLTADRVDPRTNEKLYRDIAEGCYFGFGYTGPTWRGDVYGRLPLIPGQTPDTRTAFTVAVFPNTWLVLKESLLLTGILTPTAPGRTQVRWILQFVGDAAADHEIGEAQQVVADLWRTTMRQDLEITEAQQAGRASPAANDVKFSPFWEEFPHLFQNMVLDALS